MIGCEKSEVNLLGISEIDLGTLAENFCALTVPKPKCLKLKMNKCDDYNAYLKVNIGFSVPKKLNNTRKLNNANTKNNNRCNNKWNG